MGRKKVKKGSSSTALTASSSIPVTAVATPKKLDVEASAAEVVRRKLEQEAASRKAEEEERAQRMAEEDAKRAKL